MMDIENIEEACQKIDDGIRQLGCGPLSYSLRKLTSVYKFAQSLAPYQVGSRVTLTVTPPINEKMNWGWLGDKHFLVAGAKATVLEIHVNGDGFSYDVEFDEDSWIDHDKVVHMRSTEERHRFHLHQSWLTVSP